VIVLLKYFIVLEEKQFVYSLNSKLKYADYDHPILSFDVSYFCN